MAARGMLRIHYQGSHAPGTWSPGGRLPQDVEWLDLLDPTPDERQAAEALLQTALPQRDEIKGLGLSSGQRRNDRMLSVHAHLCADRSADDPTPLSILVTRTYLVTLHYAPSRPLQKVAASIPQSPDRLYGPDLLVMLFQAIVDDVANQMQTVASDVARLSDDVFTNEHERTRVLRDKLLRVGKIETGLARLRTSLLGIGRGVGFVENRAPDWFGDEALGGVKTVANDLKTLDEFDNHLTGKLQFLQDAVLGFINTDQNAVMKLLTVASVVTIPPVILAGIWGMNFKHMPELDPWWGYPMALGALLASIVVPLAWFGARGWLSRD